MAVADRVEDVVASVAAGGLGAVTLSGTPPIRRQVLAKLGGVGTTFDYNLEQGPLWETGRATIVGVNTFSRAPGDSSSGGAAVAFTAGALFAHDLSAVTLNKVPTVDTVAFTTAIPLTALGQRHMTQQSVSGPLSFTAAANPVLGALVYSRLVANGVNIPAFIGMKEWGGSLGWDNTNGITNQVQYFYDGVDLWYSISQAVGATPVDSVKPTAVSAAVSNAAPTVIAVTMSEAMDSSNVPVAGAFTVDGHTVQSVAISGGFINLTITPAFVNSEAARAASYAQPGTNNARDMAGNLLDNFTGLTITNNVQPVDSTAPTPVSAQVANAAPTVIQVTFSESLANSIPPSAAFGLSGGKTAVSVAVSGIIASITANSAYVFGDAITVTHTKPGSNPRLQDAAGNAVESFGPLAVTNNVGAAATAPGAPTIGTATAGDGSVSTTFTAPASNGGSAITGYTASVYKVSDNALVATASGASSPINVTGVPNGTAVYTKVAAVNNVGTGTQSAASNNVTPAAISYPRLTGLSATTIESGSGPYTYTGNGGTIAAETGGVTAKSLPLNTDGWIEFEIVAPNEIVVGFRHLNSASAYTNHRFGFYAPGNAAGIPTSYRRTGTLVTAGPNSAGLTPAAGDRFRVARVGNILYTQLARAATPTTFVALDSVDYTSAPQLWVCGIATNTAAFRLLNSSGFV